MARKDDFIVRGSILIEYVGVNPVVIIPDNIKGIGKNAFINASYHDENYVSEIHIPENLDKISIEAFNGCTNLKKIEVIQSNKTFSAKNGVLYSKDGKTLVALPKGIEGSYGIPEGVENIYSKAFSGCNKLNSITIPKSVKTINGTAFLDTLNLTNIVVDRRSPYFVYIDGVLFSKDGSHLVHYFNNENESFEVPQCVKELDNYAFYDAKAIKEIILPHNLERIGKACFMNCEALESMRIKDEYKNITENTKGVFVMPYSITEVEDDTFSGCSSMDKITLSYDITRIGKRAFNKCSSLYDFSIPRRVEIIDEDAFRYCSSLKSIFVPKNVSEIGEGAFSFCENLEDITLEDNEHKYMSNEGILYCPETKTILQVLKGQESTFIVGDMVNKIGKGAFALCYDVENILCSKSVTSIGDNAFENCNNLTAISFQGNLEEIGKEAFSGCLRLSEVNNLGSIVEIREGTFNNCASLKSIALPQTLGFVGKEAFNNCVNLKNISLPEKLDVISRWAFYNCSSLGSIKIPGSVKVIDCSFLSCKNLERVVLNEGTEAISSYAFYDCENLIELVLPNSLKRIGFNAFDGCVNLKEINIGDEVSFIGNEAFENDGELEKINVSSLNDTFSSYDGSLFTKDGTCLLKIPEGKRGEYELPEFVTNINWKSCTNLTKLTKLKLSSTVDKIEFNAFSGTDENIVDR